MKEWIVLTVFWVLITVTMGFYIDRNTQRIKELETTTTHLAEQNLILAEAYKELTQKIDNLSKRYVTVTAYSANRRRCDSTPHLTAFMTKPRVGTVAISRDLLRQYSPGDRVYLKGFGVFIVNDLMNARFEKRVDVFVSSPRKARSFGIRKNVLAVRIR